MHSPKLGLMVPINNTTMDPELRAWLPPGSQCEVRRIPRGKGLLTLETVPAYCDAALSLAADYAPMPLDAVVYGCTAAGFLGGPASDAQLRERLASITGKPVITTANAMIEALQAEGVRRLAVVTPYLEAVNRQLSAYLAAYDIEVRRFATFAAPDTDALGRITGPEVAELARQTMADDCDALFIGCSQLPTHAIVDALRLEFQRPVWSSIRATAWSVYRSFDRSAVRA